MADVQPEDGYVRIANNLFDAIIALRIPGEVRRVFDYIIRHTYGFNRKTFETTHYRIAKDLGMKRPRVSEALKILKNRKMINGTENRTVLSRNDATTLGIQKDFEKWENGTENRTDTKPNNFKSFNSKRAGQRYRKPYRSQNIENGTENRTVNGTENRTTILLKTKDNNKSSIPKTVQRTVPIKHSRKKPKYAPPTGDHLLSNGYPWIDKTAWDDFVQHRIEIKKALTPGAVKKSIDFLSRYKSQQKEIIDASIRSGWQGLFPIKSGKRILASSVTYNDPEEDAVRWKM